MESDGINQELQSDTAGFAKEQRSRGAAESINLTPNSPLHSSFSISLPSLRQRSAAEYKGLLTTAVAGMLLFVVSCTRQTMPEATREIQLYQNWELQPGDVVAGHTVASGLGDISIHLQGDAVYAPFNGRLQPNIPNCVIFSSEEVPSYLFRLCGLKSLHFGFRQAGEMIGKGDELHFAVLNQQPDGRWAMVEPSKKILEQVLQPQ